MNVIAHIEDALRRGKSPFTVQDVLEAYVNGNLVLCVGTKMSGSCWVRDDGRGPAVEVVHVGGDWDRDEARDMFDTMKAEAARRGLPYRWSGRKGWARFLRKEGFTT